MMIHWGAPYIRALRGIYLLIRPFTQKKREREKTEIIAPCCAFSLNILDNDGIFVKR